MREASAYAPGRTELAGNHTDHQGGRVIAAAVDCGTRVQAVPNGSALARVASEGFAPFEIDVTDLEPREGERNTSAALVRGVVAGLKGAGCEVGGFDVKVSSTVPAGSGLSSSAAFEVALSTALCELFGGGDLDPVAHARIGQAAERDFFGKPCGMMDQLAVATGGVCAFDFSGAEPRARRIGFDFERAGLVVCLIDTHCDHSLYSREYAQVALDMFAAADVFGARRLSDVGFARYLGRFDDVRREVGDLAALRGLHYFNEERLVEVRERALAEGDVKAFLAATRASGASSAQYLQNVSCMGASDQPAMVALALADVLLGGEGACRIHGGGFGGTVQAYVPQDLLGEFAESVDDVLGAGSCAAYRVGCAGAAAQAVA